MVAHPSFVGCPNAISPPIDANAPGAAGSTTLVAAEEMFSHFGYKGATIGWNRLGEWARR